MYDQSQYCTIGASRPSSYRKFVEEEARNAKSRMDVVGWLVLAISIGIVALCAICIPHCAEAREIDTIILHHTASHDVSAKTIGQWHRERGFDGIGYHYVIRADGSIEPGRPIEKAGAHAKGRNAHSIGICLTGYDTFTPAQLSACEQLVAKLCHEYGIKRIERHHEECPGRGIAVEYYARRYTTTMIARAQ